MREIVVDIVISSDEYQRLYEGSAKDVVTTARDGRTVRFPARILRPFVTHSGVRGSFLIRFNDQGKFMDVARLV